MKNYSYSSFLCFVILISANIAGACTVDVGAVRITGKQKIQSLLGPEAVGKEIGLFFQDGAAAIGDPNAIDLGALYYIEQLAPELSPGPDILVAYAMNLEGPSEVQFVKMTGPYIKTFDTTSGNAVIKSSATSTEIEKLKAELAGQFPEGNFKFLKAIGIISFSDPRNLVKIFGVLKQSATISSVELSGAVFPIPSSFSPAVPIAITTDSVNLDSHEFRAAHNKLIQQGQRFVTGPSVCSEFIEGSKFKN